MISGGKTTLDACRAMGKPFMLVFQGITRTSQVRAWLEEKAMRVLNIAGNGESKSPGIGERVERFLKECSGDSKRRDLVDMFVCPVVVKIALSCRRVSS
jgi:hypothetical protein